MGCGGTKEKEKPADESAPVTAPAPATGSAASTAAPAAAFEKGKDIKENEDGQIWISEELSNMMKDYFTRYDLDGSGTINSNDELKQLCTNLVVKLELDMDVKTIDDYVTSAGDMSSLEWKFEDFKGWFLDAFKPLVCWQPNDCSSSDEENPDQPGVLRSGTYDLVMKEGVDPTPFKLRFHDDDKTELFKRVVNDEKLGYKQTSTTGDGKAVKSPAGLHSFTGSFDHAAKTCKFTKSYDVDYDVNTKEPIFEFDGKIESVTKITGTWKNVETDPNAQTILDKLGLGSEGTFTMTKRPKLD